MTSNRYHEIRDPIHDFIRLDSEQRLVLDSPYVQRLRNIHQLAMSYLVYPGATHRRFEHSLGVMELAGRVFDTVTDVNRSMHPSALNLVNSVPGEMSYWRDVVQMAALCHDIGHLPFSHAAEHELLPEGRSHESITADLILGDSMSEIWDAMRPRLNPMDIAKVSVGQEKLPSEEFTDWENLLYEIIGSDALGVDRMDYLLRDSHHAGVAYGRFDHYRLIDTMRILPSGENSDEPTLGIEAGGIHSSEALLLARYFMFMQVYCHPVRVAYDIHLQEFLKAWLPAGKMPEAKTDFLNLNDNTVLEAIAKASSGPNSEAQEHAKRITDRGHFRLLYEPTLEEKRELEDPLAAVADACIEKFGKANIRRYSYPPKQAQVDFPVLGRRGRIESSHAISQVLSNIPIVDVGYVLVAPDLSDEARRWLSNEKTNILN